MNMPILLALGWEHYAFTIPLSLLSIFLSLVILVQRGRGGGLTGALGGMGGQSAFGTKAGDLFTRITVGVAAVWILLSMVALKMLNKTGMTVAAPPPATAPTQGGTTTDTPATGGTKRGTDKEADKEADKGTTKGTGGADKSKTGKATPETGKATSGSPPATGTPATGTAPVTGTTPVEGTPPATTTPATTTPEPAPTTPPASTTPPATPDPTPAKSGDEPAATKAPE